MDGSKKDHAELGKQLDYFINIPEVGKGLPLLTPKGAALKRILREFIEQEEVKRGYVLTDTPLMASSALYEVSGHWALYRDTMFVMDGSGSLPLALRPMTCPFQFLLYKRKTRSYRELPVRYAETSTLFRNEESGAMHGLIRIRQFTLADGHILCRPDQVEEEFLAAFDLNRYVMDTLGLNEYSYRFSKYRPGEKGKYIDDPAAWEASQALLKRLLDKTGVEYTEAEGEAAFYGPKLDVQMRNVWGKEDTILTLQIDFALPSRFALTYIDSNGEPKTPMAIHRSSIGCYERTIAMLLERYQGGLPFWLSPEQVRILTVNDSLNGYADGLKSQFVLERVRAARDESGETLGKKIRNAKMDKVPVIAIVGEKERDAGTVSLMLPEGEKADGMPAGQFLQLCKAWGKARSVMLTVDG